jgi:hypothetical protein
MSACNCGREHGWHHATCPALRTEELPRIQVGDLVKYVPTHAHGDTHHRDCEIGVVRRIGHEGTVFVLFNGCTPQGCYPDSLVRLAR